MANGRPGSRYGKWLALALVAGVLALQWPLYKSMALGLMNIDPPDDGIGWRSDFDAALVEAEAAGKPLLVNFAADWCGPCVAMKRDVWPSDAVRQAVLAGYVPVRLDVDTAEGRRIGSHFGVRMIPTTIVIDPAGEELRRVNYVSDGEMTAWLAESE